MEQRLPGLPEHHVLLVNRNHPLVMGLLKIKSGSVLVGEQTISPTEALSKDIALHIYDMARISVGGIEPTEIASLQSRNSALMSTLIERSL